MATRPNVKYAYTEASIDRCTQCGGTHSRVRFVKLESPYLRSGNFSELQGVCPANGGKLLLSGQHVTA